MTAAKAEKKYWDDLWAKGQVLRWVEPQNFGWKDFVDRHFHEYFSTVFAGLDTRGRKLIEIGCGGSGWLPYFSKEFEFQVAGIDYSEEGCDVGRRILANAGVKAEVVCADFFDAPSELREAFDILVSFGVAEHFETTAHCIEAFARYVKPGGMIITIIPNMVGMAGAVQKILNRPVYDIHVPLSAKDLANAHKTAGLRVVECSYLMSVYFGVCNLNGLTSDSIRFKLKKVTLWLLRQQSVCVWMLERITGPFSATKLFSPYITCRALKK